MMAMDAAPGGLARPLLEDIDFAAADRAGMSGDDTLFFLLTTASLIETTSHLYTSNLIEYCADEPELVRWLKERWEPEELAHGRALRAYVAAVWPEFDWEQANAAFFADYSQRCKVEALQSTRGLEMIARCVVAMGTSTMYGMIHDYARDPILRQVAAHLRSDEARHFSYFHTFFREFEKREGNGRLNVLKTMFRRLVAISDSDAYTAFRHVFKVRFPDRPFSDAHYFRFNEQMRQMLRAHYSYTMATRLLLKPLELGLEVERVLASILARGGNALAVGHVVATTVSLWLGRGSGAPAATISSTH